MQTTTRNEVIPKASHSWQNRRVLVTGAGDFIGSPPMNLLECEVDHANRVLQLDGLPILAFGQLHHAAALSTLMQVTLGIRPEHLTISAEPKASSLPARLYIVQELGSETLAILRVSQKLVTVRVYSHELPALPEQVWLEMQPERVFLYGTDGNLLS